jgi:hypothetical protein
VIKGNEMSVCFKPSNSRFAFSAASLKRCGQKNEQKGAKKKEKKKKNKTW